MTTHSGIKIKLKACSHNTNNQTSQPPTSSTFRRMKCERHRRNYESTLAHLKAIVVRIIQINMLKTHCISFCAYTLIASIWSVIRLNMNSNHTWDAKTYVCSRDCEASNVQLIRTHRVVYVCVFAFRERERERNHRLENLIPPAWPNYYVTSLRCSGSTHKCYLCLFFDFPHTTTEEKEEWFEYSMKVHGKIEEREEKKYFINSAQCIIYCAIYFNMIPTHTHSYVWLIKSLRCSGWSGC